MQAKAKATPSRVIFPAAINDALKSTERDHNVEVWAQQDDKNIFGDPAEIFGPGKALETILAKLGKAGLELNKKKFQVFGTTEGDCADKPEWLDETIVVRDTAARARVEVAEAEAAVAAAAAASASPENAAAAAATAAEAKKVGQETRRGAPRSACAHGGWICGAALGSEGYVMARLNEAQVRLEDKVALMAPF